MIIVVFLTLIISHLLSVRASQEPRDLSRYKLPAGANSVERIALVIGNGAKKTVCPHCNQSLARKKSAAATRRFR
jgi:RNase P subunit RPR2